MADLVSYLTYWLQQFFMPSFDSHFLTRFFELFISEPLFLAVVAMFFAGFIVSIFVRLFHTS